MTKKLFPLDQPEREWRQFSAEGFSEAVCGVIYRIGKPPCCGVALGGISTGCIDMDARGVYGFCSIFNPVSQYRTYKQNRESYGMFVPMPYGSDKMPRKLPKPEPLIGLAVDGKVWVLASKEFVDGGELPWCTEPLNEEDRYNPPPPDIIKCSRIEGVIPAQEIHYWGHYPVADMEFDTDAPISVGMRAWAPFIPGDAAASNIPSAIFEVHVRNTCEIIKEGTIAFNFPGPDIWEATAGGFVRHHVKEDFEGIMVISEKEVNYILGVVGDEKARFGSGLSSTSWCKIATELPGSPGGEHNGIKQYRDSSASAAVDFSIKPGKEKIVRFMLTWYAPIWEGAERTLTTRTTEDGKNWKGSRWTDKNCYTHMYASRYDSSLDIARRMALEHEKLLGRIISWQNTVYSERKLPIWLRDSLVNILYLVAEDSYWAQAKPPLGDWCYPGGLFAFNESPRGCPHMGCIPCDWFGNLPIVFFFPELALSTLKAYKQYQRQDGAAPFELGSQRSPLDLATMGHSWQVSLNGTVYIDLVDRVWQRMGDDRVLSEFYESVKRCNTFTMNLRSGPGGVISMPEGNRGSEWFEACEWAGMCAHLGGLRLMQLRLMERMAGVLGDDEYAKQCREWLDDGSNAMHEKMWTGSYYLNYYERETGKKSDAVMAYQLDGEWAAEFHDVPGVFDIHRVKKALQTIKNCNIAIKSEFGAVDFACPDGSPLAVDSKVAAYGRFTMSSPNILVLAMTYMYKGEREFGLDLARRLWENIVLKQRHTWDMPQMIRGDTGQRILGTDYYTNMMLWSLPAALEGKDIRSFCATGGLIDRIIRAGKEQ